MLITSGAWRIQARCVQTQAELVEIAKAADTIRKRLKILSRQQASLIRRLQTAPEKTAEKLRTQLTGIHLEQEVLRAELRAIHENEIDPESFFVQGAAQNRRTPYCNPCPVKNHCLAEALDCRIEFGVWGGETERDRRATLRRIGSFEPLYWWDLLVGNHEAFHLMCALLDAIRASGGRIKETGLSVIADRLGITLDDLRGFVQFLVAKGTVTIVPGQPGMPSDYEMVDLMSDDRQVAAAAAREMGRLPAMQAPYGAREPAPDDTPKANPSDAVTTTPDRFRFRTYELLRRLASEPNAACNTAPGIRRVVGELNGRSLSSQDTVFIALSRANIITCEWRVAYGGQVIQSIALTPQGQAWLEQNREEIDRIIATGRALVEQYAAETANRAKLSGRSPETERRQLIERGLDAVPPSASERRQQAAARAEWEDTDDALIHDPDEDQDEDDQKSSDPSLGQKRPAKKSVAKKTAAKKAAARKATTTKPAPVPPPAPATVPTPARMAPPLPAPSAPTPVRPMHSAPVPDTGAAPLSEGAEQLLARIRQHWGNGREVVADQTRFSASLAASVLQVHGWFGELAQRRIIEFGQVGHNWRFRLAAPQRTARGVRGTSTTRAAEQNPRKAAGTPVPARSTPACSRPVTREAVLTAVNLVAHRRITVAAFRAHIDDEFGGNADAANTAIHDLVKEGVLKIHPDAEGMRIAINNQPS